MTDALVIHGAAAASGIAIGSAVWYRAPQFEPIPTKHPEVADDETNRFLTARQQAEQELSVLRESVASFAPDDTVDIFAAHSLLLNDPMFESLVREELAAHKSAEAAIKIAVGRIVALLGEAGRGDILDVGNRLIRILRGDPQEFPLPRESGILFAQDLVPSQAVQLSPKSVIGLCLAEGGATSHTAVIARMLGIPAVLGIGHAALKSIQDGEYSEFILNGDAGVVIADPSPATRKRYQEQRVALQTRAAELKAVASAETHTADGMPVAVHANISDVASAKIAVEHGAEGVGLLRTEIHYLDAPAYPSEEEQVNFLRPILAEMDTRPVTIRLFDLGGDKPPAFLDFPAQTNPFLGWRGVRVLLDHPRLLVTHLRAILRSAVGYDVRVMVPMVESMETLRSVRQIWDQVRQELATEDIAYNPDVPLGIMVETPSAVLLADHLARYADFFSIGSNDLTQYTLAADRADPSATRYYQALSPAVLRQIRRVIEVSFNAQLDVSVCGELAAHPIAVPVLLGLGLRRFSVTPTAIPHVKHIIRQLSQDVATHIAQHCLTLATAAEVEAYLQEQFHHLGLD